MPAIMQGGCQCGAVRYALEGPLPHAYACHCVDCQKQSASAFSLSIPVVREALEVSGPLASFAKRSDSGAVTTCWFCPSCGARVFHTSNRSPSAATLKAGTLDDASSVVPAAHLWIRRKQPWVQLDPDLPAYETQPDDLAGWREGLQAPPAT
jgi:hypothetical protein